MKKLFELMDVATALTRSLAWAKSQRGAHAGVLACWLFLVSLVMGWLCWHFDIESTMEWAKGIQPTVMGSLSEQLLLWGPMILVLIALVPTLLRQSLSGMAQVLPLVAGLLFIVGLFDMQTDWPRVAAFFDLPVVWNVFAWAGPAQGLIWFIARLAFMFFATDGFEVIFVVCAASTVMLAMQSRKS